MDYRSKHRVTIVCFSFQDSSSSTVLAKDVLVHPYSLLLKSIFTTPKGMSKTVRVDYQRQHMMYEYA